MKALRAFARMLESSFRLIGVLTLAVGVAAGQQTTQEAAPEQKSTTTMQRPAGSPVTLGELIREVE